MGKNTSNDKDDARVSERSDLRRRRTMRRFAALASGVLVFICLSLIPLGHYAGGHPWDSARMIGTYLMAGTTTLLILGIWIILKTARTRYSVERDIIEHRDVNQYAILWDRPRWVLYLPTMAISVAFGIWSSILPSGSYMEVIGGIWIALGLLNISIEQFHMSLKTLLVIIPTVAMIFLIFHLVGIADEVITLMRFFFVNVPPKLYFVVAFIISTVIFIGWFQGLFNYMAVTPNVADFQTGLTETGTQIRNDDYEISFDASDILERWLFGFGRIIIHFPSSDRSTMIFFVPHAAEIDDTIRRVRSVTAIDQSNDS